MDTSTIRKVLSRDLTDTIIRIGMILLLAIVCIRVIAPFAGLMQWALILAVALYPVHQAVARRLGGHQGGAAALLVLIALLVIGLPMVVLGGSFAGHVQDAYTSFQNDTLTLRKPPEAVAEWPLVGPRLYSAWNAAAEDLPAYVMDNKAELQNLALQGLSLAANTAGSVAIFLGSLVISGIIMAYAEPGSQAMSRIFTRLTDPERGPRLQRLSTATVRSVANGVIGVAFIQALLLGIGFIIAGVPAAGVLAFVVMIVGILQLPAMIISLPVIGYIWWTGDASTTSNVVITVYLVIAGMADNILKPLLLGRGVDAPMPVILLGALGGMVTSGIIGLFLGAVVLAVGYQLFMEWVETTGAQAGGPDALASAPGGSTDPGTPGST